MSDPGLDALLERHGSPATRLLSARLMEIDAAGGVARFRFLAPAEFANVLGHVQGGLVAAMLDEAAGLTARLLGEEGLVTPSLDFRVTFFRPAKVGVLFATGRRLRVGRRVAFLEADLYDGNGELLSRMNLTALATRAP